MIGIVVATHGKFSEGIVDAAEVIVGAADNIETLQLNQGDDIEALNTEMVEAIKKVDQGDGVIVFTDLAGASPYNQAAIAIHSLPEEVKKKMYVFSGVNLPMLIEAINHRMIGSVLDEVVADIAESAKNGITYWPETDESLEEVDDDF